MQRFQEGPGPQSIGRADQADGSAASSEDKRALDEMFSLVYEELHRLASQIKSGDCGVTLNPTSLVHEAWLKLALSPKVAKTSPLHFKRIAGKAMRQLLVDAARRRQAEKRGGKGAIFVAFDDSFGAEPRSMEEFLTLDAAMAELEAASPRQAAIVEARYFSGLTVEETAESLNISEETVQRDWRAALAWLKHKLATP